MDTKRTLSALKRIGCLALALILVLSLLPVLPHTHVHAAETDEYSYTLIFATKYCGTAENSGHLDITKNDDNHPKGKKLTVTATVTDASGTKVDSAAWVGVLRGAYTLDSDFSDAEVLYRYDVKEKTSGGTAYNGGGIPIGNKSISLYADHYSLVLFKDQTLASPARVITFDITWDNVTETVTTPASCTAAGVKHQVYVGAYSDKNETKQWEYDVPIPALGHDVDFAEVTGTDTHSAVCARDNCGETVTENCTFEDHVCTVCGGDEELYTDKTVYKYGEPILVTVNQYGDDWDWVGLYKKGETYDPPAGGSASIYWYYVYDPGMSTSGVNILATRDENGRSGEFVAGEYTIVFFPFGGYAPGATVDITITTEIDESKTETTPATCDENGCITYTYTDSTTKTVLWEDIEDETLKAQLKATGHDYSADPVPVEGVVGKHVYTCGNNSAHTKEEDCAWDGGEVTAEPEEGQNGVMTYTCTLCGGERTEDISAKTIDHTDTFDATCTKGSYKIDYYTDGTNSGEIPTGTAALNHIYGDPVHNEGSDPSSHTKTCTREGCTEAQADHSVTENCTYEGSTVPGGTRYTCSGCGDYYDVIILSTNKTEYALGEPILVTVNNEVYDETATDWVGIWENDWNHSNGVSIYYYYPSSQGWTDFNIYNSAYHQRDHIAQGTYTIRLYAADSYTEITNVTITVGPAVRDESKTVRVEPTCETDGSITYYLTDGTVEKVVTAAEDETLKKLGHAYPDTWTPVAGTETHTRVCGNNAEHVETKGCSWDEGVETVPPTADTKGEMEYTCTVCDNTKTEDIPVLSAEETGRQVIAPTCTDQGYTLITYSDGSTRKIDFVPALDHDFGGAYTRIDGTHTHSQACQRENCDEVEVTNCEMEVDGVLDGDGYYYACTKCGEWNEPVILTNKTIYASGEDIIVTIHPNYAANMGAKDWIGLYHKGEVPTQGGLTSIRWNYVGDFVDGMSIFETSNHDRHEEDPNNFLKAGEYALFLCKNDGYEILAKVYFTVITEEDPTKTVQVDSTCTEDGIITYYNTDGSVSRVVTAAEDENLKAHGHTYGTWTYNGVEEQNHTHTCICTKCAETCTHSETFGCEWDEGVETKPATEQETGIKTYTCTICQGTREEVLPKLNVTVTGTEEDPATCEEPGNLRTFYSDGTYSDTVIPAKGHDYSDWTMVEGENKHQKVCANDATHILSEDCTITSEVSGTKVTHTCSVCEGSYETGLVATDKKVYGVTDPIYVTAYATYPGAWVGLYKEGELFDPDNGGVASLFWAYTDGRVGQPFDLTAVEATTTSGHRGEKLGNGKYVLVFFGDSGYTNPIQTVELEVFTDMSGVEFKLEFLGHNERQNGAHIQVNANKFDYVSNSGNQVTTYVYPLKKGTTEAADPLTAWIAVYEGSLNLESDYKDLTPMKSFNVAEHNGTKITLNLPKYGMNFIPGYIYTLVVFADAGTTQPVKYITFESIREIESETVYKQATCEAPGLKYVVYKDDGKDHTEDEAMITVPALGHDMSELACIEGTNTHGKHCQREDCDYAETEGCSFENGACTVCGGAEYHIHSLTHVPAAPAGCENSGNTEYYTCRCGDWFADAEAATKIADKNSVVIPAKSHAYSTWQYNAAEKKHVKTCANDASHVISESCVFDAGVVTKQATAAAEGEKTFTCATCQGTYTEAIPMVSYEGGERVSGATRYHTAIQVADSLKEALGVEKFDAIVVASGLEFADSLSGTYLANKKNAPILLVRNRTEELTLVKDYIKANLKSGGTVYLLGGTTAMPKAMETGLDGFNVKRLGGATRYDTNLLILKEAGVTSGEEILICTGKNFADSLSASALNKPILLVKDSLSAEQTAFLESVSAGKIYIIGGNAAISDRIANVLNLYGNTERISGATRYETSINIAKKFFGDTKNAVLAFGEEFPDGLCGGTLASKMNAPVILVANSANKYTMAAEYVAASGASGGVVLGGTTRINNSVMQTIFK